MRTFAVEFGVFFACSLILATSLGLNFIENVGACAVLAVVASLWGRAFGGHA